MKKILLLAQVPPPFHGQAIMQKYLVDARWLWCRKEHVRLEYSDTIAEIGHFRLSKIARLLRVLRAVLQAGRQQAIEILYYPPAGPNRVPLYRDIITLLFAKLFAKKIILHFHAGGLSELIRRLTGIERFFARLAFRHIDVAIVQLPWLKREVAWFAPKNVLIIPNGIEDVAMHYPLSKKINDAAPGILFVGNLKEEKGIFVLLKATAQLKKRGLKFRLSVMGEAHSDSVRQEIEIIIAKNNLAENVVLHGPLTGKKKWDEFRKASIFCLPTYTTESMPVSILEAMMFSLPVVSTQWRGIPDMIADGEEGFLTPIKDADTLACKLAELINDSDKRRKIGDRGREKFERFYTIESHLSKMEAAFKRTAEGETHLQKEKASVLSN